ncbi:MAG: hypothetical protein KDB61_16440, partial [Planctomycetes bacterium]|nr:hypothetical protein [Planctomycetota bacterium]
MRKEVPTAIQLSILALTCGPLAGQVGQAGSTGQADPLQGYDVVWESPSQDSSQSMPCGGGDIGLNVWVEGGEVLFYMQRSGSLAENNEYLKLGRVRLRLDPNPFAGSDSTFRQELKLREGLVEIHGG